MKPIKIHSRRFPSKGALRSFLLGLLVAAALSQSAYLILTGMEQKPLSWQGDKIPVQFQIWQGFNDALPSIVQGSRPKLAIREALNEWVQVSALSARLTETNLKRAGEDGVNLITISDDPQNLDVVGDRLAVALVWGRPSEIMETDILFNPYTEDPWSTVEARRTMNLYDVAVHEFGHSLGLEHSVARSSRMFFQGGSYTFGLRGIAYDDFSGVSLLYPLPGIEQITGSVAGRVTRNGQPVFGAFVVVADEHGALAANSITGREGFYRIDRIPPGLYTVYAEPLDGPTTPTNLSGTLFEPTSDLVTDFLPGFYQDSLDPLVQVVAGATTAGIDLTVSAGNVEVDPLLIGIAPDLQSGVRVTSTPSSAFQGSSPNFVAAGGGVEQLPEQGAFDLLGSLSTTGDVALTLSNSTLTFKFFPMTIPESAPRGEYSALFRRGDQLGVVTGGFHVFSPFRYLQAFGQFAHLPGSAASRLFLVNLDRQFPSDGRILAGRSVDEVQLNGLSADPGHEFAFHLEPAGVVLTGSVGGVEFRGGLVSEATQRLGAAVLVKTPFGTTGLAPSPPLRWFVAPVEVAASGAAVDTGLALANLDQRDALIYLQAQDQAGRVVGQTVLELGPAGQIAIFVRELIPELPADFQGSVLATANRDVTATLIRTSPGVFTTLPVIQNRVAPRTVFPQFAHFGSLSSELVLVNPSPTRTASAVTVRVRDQSGNPAPVTLNGVFYPTGRVILNLPPLGSTVLRTSDTQVVGWVEVTALLPVGGVLLYRSSEVGTAGIGRATLSTSQVLPIARDVANSTDLGIAIVNAEPRSVTVNLQARDTNGNPVGNARQVTLAPWQQIARFPNQGEIDLNLPDDFTGSVWFEAGGLVGISGVCQSPGVLTTFPAFDRRLPVAPAVE